MIAPVGLQDAAGGEQGSSRWGWGLEMGSSYGSGRVVSCQTSVERCWAKTSGLSRRVLGRPLGQLTDWVWCWYLVRSRLIVLHWSAEELDCSMVSLSWIQRFLSFRADFRILLRRVFNVCGGVSGVTCERRSSVCSVIYGFLVLRFCFGKLESIAAVSA